MVSKIQIETIATFLIIWKAHINILFILKVNIKVLIKYSYSPPPTHPPEHKTMLTIHHEWLSYFEHIVQSL